MPCYEYRCRACGDTFELTRPMSESADPCRCPQGHDDTVKLLSAVASAAGPRRRPGRPAAGRAAAAAASAAAGGDPRRSTGPVTMISEDRWYAGIRESTARLADLVADEDETRPIPERPIGHYPRTKALAEKAALAASRDGLEVVVVRPRFVWGKGDTSLLPKIATGNAFVLGISVALAFRHTRYRSGLSFTSVTWAQKNAVLPNTARPGSSTR